MNILVTGGTGYIGSHLARAFKNNGNQVAVIDKVLRPHALKDIDNFLIKDFASKEAFEFIQKVNPDVIAHCAGSSVVRPSITDPSNYWNNNVVKNIQLLDFIKDLKKKPLILFSSSCSVYGNPEQLPILESHAVNPISPYGNTKITFEKILHDYHQAYGISSVCFRYFNTAGAEPFNFDLGQEPGVPHLIARALESCIKGETFYLYGNNYDTKDGTGIRDYIHVWDLAMAHIKVIENMTDLGTRIYNLGSGKGISNQEIINYIQNKFGKFNVVVDNARIGDPAKLYANGDRFQKDFNWNMQFSSIESMIDSAYKWYKRIL